MTKLAEDLGYELMLVQSVVRRHEVSLGRQGELTLKEVNIFCNVDFSDLVQRSCQDHEAARLS